MIFDRLVHALYNHVTALLRLRETCKVMRAVGVKITDEMFEKMVDIYIGSLCQAPDQPTSRLTPPTDGTIYYLRVGSLVKIGYTGNLSQRLTAYPPDSVLLATEEGGEIAERLRHEQFAADIAHGREWFRPSADLIEHINSLRDEPLKAAELAT